MQAKGGPLSTRHITVSATSVKFVEKIDFWADFAQIVVISMALRFFLNSNLIKKITIEYFLMIFCSSESWDAIFFKNYKGGPKGGPPAALFKFELFKFFKKNKKFWKFQS